MKKKGTYSGTDTMSELVERHYRVLLIMSRFGIGLGFGERTIGEVCADHGADTETFLAVVHILLDGGRQTGYDTSRVSPGALLDYLTRSHDYFTGFRLPGIRRALVEVLGDPEDELTRAVMHYFDEYVEEVRLHMTREERTLFPHVRALREGRRDEGRFPHDDSHRKHDHIQTRLAEFKRILIKYYPARSTNRLNAVLFDIYNCEHDLAAHNEAEDLLLVPIIRELERKIDAAP